MGIETESWVAARDTLGRALEALELADYLFALDPGPQGWDVRVECRCREGSHVSRFVLDEELLAGFDRDPPLRGRLMQRLRAHLGDCTRAARSEPTPVAADTDPGETPETDSSMLGALSEFSATAGGTQPSLPDLLSPRPVVQHPMTHFDAPDPSRRELYWYALEQATQDPRPREADLAPAEEAAMHLVRQKAHRARMSPGNPMDTRVSALMTADVEAVSPDAALGYVRDLFMQSDLHHIPVVDGERLVGLISLHDLRRLGVECFEGRVRARDVMQARPVTAREDCSVREAAALLSQGAFHGLPVVDGRDRLRGIVTSTDLLRFFVEALS